MKYDKLEPEEVPSLLPIPKAVYDDFHALNLQTLKAKGIKVILADLDNTLVAYGDSHPTPQVIQWKKDLDDAQITLFILSNSRKSGRVDVFAQALDVPFQAWSGKPKKKGYRRALERLNVTPQDCLMLGDQIFTDILGATRMNIPAILVKPIMFSNFGQYLRYHILEYPFRQAGKKNHFTEESS